MGGSSNPWMGFEEYMSKTIIAAKIDVTKIDKDRLFQGKNGAKYLDVILIESPESRYGDDFMVTQQVTKEEREQGARGAILGNAKYLGRGKSSSPARTTSAPTTTDDGDGSVPF